MRAGKGEAQTGVFDVGGILDSVKTSQKGKARKDYFLISGDRPVVTTSGRVGEEPTKTKIRWRSEPYLHATGLSAERVYEQRFQSKKERRDATKPHPGLR